MRLTVDGKAYAAPLTVRMDPRVKVSVTSLEKKFQTELRLSSLITRTSQSILQAASVRDQLQRLGDQATGATKDSVEAFQKKLAAVLGGPPTPFAPVAEQITLNQASGQATTLYGQVWQVDAEPTAAQLDGVATAEHAAAEATKRWDALESSDLQTLNHELRSAHLPEVQRESDNHKDEAPTDEE